MIPSKQPMLFDVTEVTDVMRDVLEEYVGPAGWYNVYVSLLGEALDYFFFGGALRGERVIEERLISRKVPFEQAVKNSRNLYARLRMIFSIPEDNAEQRSHYNYTLYMPEHMVVLYPLDHHAPPTRCILSPELAMAEIEDAIERGDYVPENLRRTYEQYRRAW